jgi:predicted transglutaminase-like cysteine proteinase
MKTCLRLADIKKSAYVMALALTIGFMPCATQTASATSLQTSADGNHQTQAQPVSLHPGKAIVQSLRTPSLFGTAESRSADTSAFTKFNKAVALLNDTTAPLPRELAALKDAPLLAKVEAVNAHYNKVRYIEDKNNYGKSDYWAMPAEFTRVGGDCEDYVLAKYSALKDLGVSEDKLRMVILQDTLKNLPHAILVVYTEDGAKFLDNQFKTVKDVAGFTRYAPIYSINRTGWWRHT